MVTIVKETEGIQKTILVTEGEEIQISFPDTPAANRTWTCPVGFNAVININIAIDELPI